MLFRDWKSSNEYTWKSLYDEYEKLNTYERRKYDKIPENVKPGILLEISRAKYYNKLKKENPEYLEKEKERKRIQYKENPEIREQKKKYNLWRKYNKINHPKLTEADKLTFSFELL